MISPVPTVSHSLANQAHPKPLHASIPFSVSIFHFRRVVCACSSGAVGSFSNKPLFRQNMNHIQAASVFAITLHFTRLFNVTQCVHAALGVVEAAREAAHRLRTQ